jgi:hypothetical protein
VEIVEDQRDAASLRGPMCMVESKDLVAAYHCSIYTPDQADEKTNFQAQIGPRLLHFRQGHDLQYLKNIQIPIVTTASYNKRMSYT